MQQANPDVIVAGVLGAGVFGGFHARKYNDLDGVALAGVYDRDFERAEALAETVGAPAFRELQALISACDLVSVASPADSHVELAEQVLSANRHAYVEKPLARTPQSGEALVGLANERGLVLACGHQERVVFAAMGLLDAPERPTRIESVRRGTPNTRNRDVSCVLDLMIHDLDLALTLDSGGGWSSVDAEGVFDRVRAEISFRSGLKASFEASRVAERRERAMRISYPSGDVAVDFLAPSFRNTSAFPLDADFASAPRGRDPLGASLSGFLAAVVGAAPRPIVTGAEGLRALELALAVERAAGLHLLRASP